MESSRPIPGPKRLKVHFTLLKRLATVSGLVLLSACASINEPAIPGDPGSSAARVAKLVPVENRLIVDDLSKVVDQIYDPISTTIQINKSVENPTLLYLVGTLADSGFGVQRVSADQGANFMTYLRKQRTINERERVHFAITIGAVTISRNYDIIKKGVLSPASPVQLSGTRRPVEIVDTEKTGMTVTNPRHARAEYVATLDLDEPAPIISLITPELVRNVANRSTASPSLRALNSSKVEVNNLFYGGESTFSSLLDDFEQVERQIIVFANDSMILGDTNKALIDNFVNSKFQSGDVISLIGCSNGPTALEIGNEGLALGRATRVTEALVARGIARDAILDEGCWAPVSAGERFPSRGVVMELWRGES